MQPLGQWPECLSVGSRLWKKTAGKGLSTVFKSTACTVMGEERLCFFVRNVMLKRPLSTKGRGGTTLN